MSLKNYFILKCESKHCSLQITTGIMYIMYIDTCKIRFSNSHIPNRVSQKDELYPIC